MAILLAKREQGTSPTLPIVRNDDDSVWPPPDVELAAPHLLVGAYPPSKEEAPIFCRDASTLIPLMNFGSLIGLICVNISTIFSVIRTNRLVALQNTPRKTLLSMLRPIDIVSLTRATIFCLRPTEPQVATYIQCWRQMLYNINFVKMNLVSVLSKDLDQLRTSVNRWDYIEADRLKVVVQVKKPSVTNERHMF